MTSNNRKTENINLNNYVRKSLNSIDWDFNDAPVNSGIHSIHPYPAKFIPQIPRKLIEFFHSGDTSIVLDPFCGSGTTLIEIIKVGLMHMEQILQDYHSPRFRKGILHEIVPKNFIISLRYVLKFRGRGGMVVPKVSSSQRICRFLEQRREISPWHK